MIAQSRARTRLLATALTLALLGVLVLAGSPAARAAPGDIYVFDPFSQPGFVPAVLRVNPATGAQTVISPNDDLSLSNGGYGLLRQADGSLLLANGNAANILRIDASTGAKTVAASVNLLQDPRGLAQAPGGEVYVADVAAKRIVRVNPANNGQTPVSNDNLLVNPRSVAVAPDGFLYVVAGLRSVIRVNPANGDQTPVTSDGFLDNAQSLVVAPSGTIYVADSSGHRVVSVTNGIQDKLSEGGFLDEPQQMAFDGNGDLLVSDATAFGNGGIIRINLATKQQTPVAQNGSLGDPRGIAVEPLPAGAAGPGGSSPTPAPDKTIVATVSGKRAQRALKQKALLVDVTCPQEACTATARGSVSVPRVRGRASAAKTFKLASVKRSLKAGQKARLKLRLKKSVLRAVRKALGRGRKVTARVRTTTTDAAGNSAAKTLRITVRR